jgi:hypothetical protein
MAFFIVTTVKTIVTTHYYKAAKCHNNGAWRNCPLIHKHTCSSNTGSAGNCFLCGPRWANIVKTYGQISHLWPWGVARQLPASNGIRIENLHCWETLLGNNWWRQRIFWWAAIQWFLWHTGPSNLQLWVVGVHYIQTQCPVTHMW